MQVMVHRRDIHADTDVLMQRLAKQRELGKQGNPV